TLDGIKIHTYTIIDNDASAVSVTANGTPSETGPAAGFFRINRAGATNTSLLVNFQITGTASAPSDYASLGTSATILAGAAFVDTRTGPTNAALTVNFTVAGTAQNGSDYTLVPNSILIAAGQLSATQAIVAIDDAQIEGEETVIVALLLRDTYRVSFVASATV